MKLTLNKSITLAALISMSAIVLAGEKVNETLSAAADGVVEIQNVRGKISIIGWDKKAVKIEGELDDLAEKLIFETQGKVTVISVKMPRHNINHGDGSKLVINIPKGNRVDFNGVSTDVFIKDTTGGIDIHTVSGDVDVIDVKQQLYVNTVSGDIEIEKSSGKAKLGSVSGDVVGEFDSKEISANSVSGDIKLKLQEYDSLIATTVSGEVSISGQQRDSGNTKLSSVNGDITLSFSSKVNARANIHAGPGGRIINKMSSDNVIDVFPNQQKLKMNLGDGEGSGQIKIGTVNGDITLSGSHSKK